MSWKRFLIVAGAIGLIATLIVLAAATSPTPIERARELSSIDAYPLSTKGPRFSEWIGPGEIDGGALLEAKYGPKHSFEMLVLADDELARETFLSEKQQLEGWDEEIQQINTFADSEYCARRRAVIRCVGYLPDNPLFVRSEGPANGDDFNMLGLLRIARKHWFRV